MWCPLLLPMCDLQANNHLGLPIVRFGVWVSRFRIPKLRLRVRVLRFNFSYTFIPNQNVAKYSYVVPLYWHVDHGKLCLITNMDVTKSKVNHSMFQFQFFG